MRHIMAGTGSGVLMALFLVAGFVNTGLAKDKGSSFYIQLQLGHSSFVQSVAFSPDDKYVLSSAFENSAILWDVSSGKEIRTFSGHSDMITSVAFSPDGKYVLTGSSDKTMKLWDVSSGKEIRTFSGHADIVTSVAFSPDGKYVLTGSYDKTLKLWDVSRGKEIRTFAGHTYEVRSAVFSHDGKYIASGSIDQTIILWDARGGKLIKKLTEGGNVTSLEFSHDDRCLLAGSETCVIKLWDVSSGKQIRTFTGSSLVRRAVFSPDEKYVLSGSWDGTMILWDASNGKEIRTIVKGESRSRGDNNIQSVILTVAFSHDSKYILSGEVTIDNTHDLRLRDAASGKIVKVFTGHATRIVSVACSRDGRYLLSASDWIIELWDLASARNKMVFLGYHEKMKRPDGTEMTVFNGPAGDIKAAVLSPDGKYVLSGGRDNGMTLWDISNGKVVRYFGNLHDSEQPFTGHTGCVWSLDYTPDGRFILSGSGDKTIKMWDADSGEVLKTFAGHSKSITTVKFSPDGKYILSGSDDLTMKLWDVQNGKEVRTFAGHSGYITSVTFSPDGKYILSGSDDLTMKLWDVQNGKEVRTFIANPYSLIPVQTLVAFSPDGKYALSGSGCLLILWDIQNGKQIRTFNGHSDWISSVLFLPDGKHVVSGSIDTTTRLWNIESDNYAIFMNYITYPDYKGWLIFDSDGFWDSSRHGGDLVAMVKGMDCWSIDQFAVKNNRPDLILAKLPGADKSIILEYNKQYKKRIAKLEKLYGIKESDLSSDMHVPKTEILKTDQDGKAVKLSIKLADTKYDIVSYNIYVNDVPVYTEIGKKIKQNRTFAVTENVELSNGDNKIEVSCFNEKGAESYRAMTTASYDGKTKGNLYFIGFGVADYKDASINDLRYSENDVLDLAKKFPAMKNDYDQIYVKTYTGKDVTSANIKAAKDFVRDAGVDDTVILFISGHGMHDSDEYKTYYYLTQDTDLKNIKGTAADFETVEDILAGINPRRKLFLMDTCDSGELDDLPAKKKVTAGDKNKKGTPRTPKGIAIGYTDNRGYFDRGRFIYNDLFRRTGAVVFSSSKGGEASWEFDSLKNGAFTEAILEGLSGRADTDKNSIVTIDELRDYVSESVGKYTDNRQHPVIDRDNIHVKFELPVNNAGD